MDLKNYISCPLWAISIETVIKRTEFSFRFGFWYRIPFIERACIAFHRIHFGFWNSSARFELGTFPNWFQDIAGQYLQSNRSFRSNDQTYTWFPLTKRHRKVSLPIDATIRSSHRLIPMPSIIGSRFRVLLRSQTRHTYDSQPREQHGCRFPGDTIAYLPSFPFKIRLLRLLVSADSSEFTFGWLRNDFYETVPFTVKFEFLHPISGWSTNSDAFGIPTRIYY